MKLILFGAPGAGKGTQAEIISKEFSIPAISTGDLIRASLKQAVRTQDKHAIELKSHLDAGQFVPDALMGELLRKRLAREDCENGYILDGYPRNIPQAKTLDELGIDIDLVINVDVSDELVMDRLPNRRVCESCNTIYHMKSKPPKQEGVCDSCGGELVIRSDDNAETVKERLRIYHEQTEPLKEYYSAKGKLVVVSSAGTVDETTQQTMAALRDKLGVKPATDEA